MTEMTEQWIECIFHPDYEVSNLGEVRRKKDGKMLKQYQQQSGYMNVWLTESYGRVSVPVHRLVCVAFHGEQGYIDGLFVGHINTDRSDNRAENLHWVTPMGNMRNPITKEEMTQEELIKVITRKGQAFVVALFKDCDQVDKEVLKLVLTAYIAGATDFITEEQK